MEDYGAIIRRTFEQGSVLDAQTLFEAFLHKKARKFSSPGLFLRKF